MTQGHLFLVGVGPGDPELMTLKAVRVLREADLIAYPVTQSGASMARDIASAHLCEGQEDYGFDVPMSVDPVPAQAAYDVAASRIAACLDAGKAVAVLCEGDPLFYGSAMYLRDRLIDRYPISVVPGVTSVSAASAATGRSLVARDDILKILPATLSEASLAQELATASSVALLKTGRHFQKVCKALDDAGLSKDAVLAERVGWPDETLRPVAEARSGPAPYFSIILAHRREATQ